MFTSGETDKEILSVSGFLTGIGSHCRVVLSDFCGEFSSVDGTTIYIGGSDNRQKSVRVNHGVGSPDHIQESDISMLYYLSHSHFI